MKRLLRTICLALALALLPTAALADLQRGSSGPEVERLQRMLFENGWLFELPDGVFGRNTEQAVKDFEAYASLPVDGIADPVMVECLTVSWMQLNEEMGSEPEEGAPVGAVPAFCNHWATTDGNSRLDYCETHLRIREQVNGLMEAGTLEAAQQACQLWEDEIVRLYEMWIELSTEENRTAVAAAKALTLSSFKANRVAVESWYDSLQMEIPADEIEYAMELPMREHAAWLCSMLAITQVCD